MDSKKLELAKQKNKVDAMEKELKSGSIEHPHDRIQHRMNIILERIKLGYLLQSIN